MTGLFHIPGTRQTPPQRCRSIAVAWKSGSEWLRACPPPSTAASTATYLGLLAVTAGLGCSEPPLDGVSYRCSNSSQCGPQELCTDVAGEPSCRPREDVPIRIGMTGPLQGPSQDLGLEMRRGIEAHFQRINDAGGVHLRRLSLSSANDDYDPDKAVEAVRSLLDLQKPGPALPEVQGPNSVFALLGSIGTPTMLRTAPIANEHGVLFFGPFTGAQTYLRDGTNSPYVYNYRAGYYDEAAAIIDYITSDRIPQVVRNPTEDHARVLVFAQEDSYGDAGYRGITQAYNEVYALPESTALLRLDYFRENVESVTPAVDAAKERLNRLLEGPEEQQSVAIVMVDTYQPGNVFIRQLKDWINEDESRARRLDVLYIHVSFVGSDSLLEELTAPPATYVDVRDNTNTRPYTEGVMVTQVVPYYHSETAAVAEYREAIRAYDDAGFSFTSLEGYLVAKLFVLALNLEGATGSTERLRATLDSQIRGFDMGIGAELNFDIADHQASSTVWGTQLKADGTFEVDFVWTPSEGIKRN